MGGAFRTRDRQSASAGHWARAQGVAGGWMAQQHL